MLVALLYRLLNSNVIAPSICVLSAFGVDEAEDHVVLVEIHAHVDPLRAFFFGFAGGLELPSPLVDLAQRTHSGIFGERGEFFGGSELSQSSCGEEKARVHGPMLARDSER